MLVLEEVISEFDKRLKGLEETIKSQSREVITLAELARLWRLSNETTAMVLRVLSAKDVKIGIQHKRNWKINKQKALDIMLQPVFEEALDVAKQEMR